jgi:hypothetical protein
MNVIQLLALATALSLAAPVMAQVPPCEGTYEGYMGKSMVKALPGNPLPNAKQIERAYNTRAAPIGYLIPNGKNTGLHSIKISQCGRQLVISQGGKSALFLQSVMDGSVYVQQNTGVKGATVTLRVVDHKFISGALKGSSHGFKYNMPVAYEPRDIHMPDMKGCSDAKAPEAKTPDENRLTVDPARRQDALNIVADEIGLPRDQIPKYLHAARSVAKTRQSDKGVTELLPGEPGCPIELKGVKTCESFPPDTTATVEVSALLDDSGQLLPIKADTPLSQPLEVDDPAAANYCALQKYTLPPAKFRLTLTFLGPEEVGINDVQANLVDAQSKIIKRSHIAERSKPGHVSRAAAAEEAYKAIGSPVTGRH